MESYGWFVNSDKRMTEKNVTNFLITSVFITFKTFGFDGNWNLVSYQHVLQGTYENLRQKLITYQNRSGDDVALRVFLRILLLELVYLDQGLSILSNYMPIGIFFLNNRSVIGGIFSVMYGRTKWSIIWKNASCW